MSKNSVAVRLSFSGLAGMKIFCDFFSRDHSNGYRKNVIQRNYQIGRRNWRGGDETCDLSERVDAGVGTPGTVHDGFGPGNARDGIGERALDGGKAGLYLPSGEVSAVVCDN